MCNKHTQYCNADGILCILTENQIEHLGWFSSDTSRIQRKMFYGLLPELHCDAENARLALYSYQMLPEETNARRRTTFPAAYWIRLKPACITLHRVCVELNSILCVEWRYWKLKYNSATSVMHITMTGCQIHLTPPHYSEPSLPCWWRHEHSTVLSGVPTIPPPSWLRLRTVNIPGKITANNIPVNLGLQLLVFVAFTYSRTQGTVRGNN